MTYLRQMAKEEREKREALEKEIEGRSDNLAKLQTEKEAAIRTRDDLIEQVKTNSIRFTALIIKICLFC